MAKDSAKPQYSIGKLRVISEADLAEVTSKWTMQQLVELWNQLPDVAQVKKFTDRKTALRRIWATAQKQPPVAVPAETKTSQVIALLRQPGGATLEAIRELTGWQNHSIRGFISAQLVKRLHLRVKSIRRDGQRVYRITN